MEWRKYKNKMYLTVSFVERKIPRSNQIIYILCIFRIITTNDYLRPRHMIEAFKNVLSEARFFISKFSLKFKF